MPLDASPERGALRPGSAIGTGAFDGAYLRQELARKGRAQLRMQGQSMAPLLPAGAHVLLRPPRRDEDLLGAIVALDIGLAVVVHRVVHCDDAHVQTQGLKAALPDAPCNRDAILGVVSARVGLPFSERALRVTARSIALCLRGLRSLRIP